VLKPEAALFTLARSVAPRAIDRNCLGEAARERHDLLKILSNAGPAESAARFERTHDRWMTVDPVR
jgi:hypothetical protein